MTQEELKTEISSLEDTLTGDMFQDMDTQEQIYSLKRQLNEFEAPTKERPDDSEFECIGCGS